MKAEQALWKASSVFAPDYPRHVSNAESFQQQVNDRSTFCSDLLEAGENEMSGYYSVYSFPRGHSKYGNIPKVNCIFIDLDIKGSNYEPNKGNTNFHDWKIDISELLVRARMIAKEILDSGEEDHFRVTLSGHKGLHLYLDFPTIAPGNGTFGQFKGGLKSYGEQVMSWLDSTAGGVNIEKWVDVDASDLGRLARHPNTIHHGAFYDDQTRWCVPITMEELADLRVEDYLRLTREPRWPSGYSRDPSESAGDKVVQAIRNAPTSTSTTSASTFDRNTVKDYEERVNCCVELMDGVGMGRKI